jgi:hypothetical protein
MFPIDTVIEQYYTYYELIIYEDKPFIIFL